MTWRSVLLAFVVALSLPCLAHAAKVGVSFTGSVSTVTPAGVGVQYAFGVPVSGPPTATPVVGQFIYDLSSPGTPTGSSKNYPQLIPNGFWAKFGETVVSADSYYVQISNSASSDRINVIFSSFAAPFPTEPLIVGDDEFTVGRFSLTLSGAPTVFNTTDLPLTVSQASFPTRSGILTQRLLFVDALFVLTSIEQFIVPEPTAASYLLPASLVGICGYRRRLRRLG